jgi:antitoxin VapB
MTLNIKDPEAHKLARTLAEITGESMTLAVTVSLRERLDRVKKSRKSDSRAAQLLAIGRDFASGLQGANIDHADLLYDDQGLPK